MQKLYSIIILLFSIIILNINTFGGTDERPWSTITDSKNHQFVFVLISNGNLDKYAARTSKSWEPLNLSPQELKDYQSNLAQTIDEEKQIRNLYQNSGLYMKDNSQNPLWTLPKDNSQNWNLDLDKIFVSNDGSFVIGFNPHVSEIKNDVPNKEETGIFIYSRDFGSKSYKVSELTNRQDEFSKSMEGYFWAKNEPVINTENKTFFVTKNNDTKLEFNISTGELLSETKSKEKYSNCLGVMSLLIVTACFLKTNFVATKL